MIRIGLDIATNTGYCKIEDFDNVPQKITQIGVRKLWYQKDYQKTAIECDNLMNQLLKRTYTTTIISIELSKYGNNNTYIFSMLTGMIIQSINKICSYKWGNFYYDDRHQIIVKLIDPNTWHNYLEFNKGDKKEQSINHANMIIRENHIISPYVEIKSDDEADAFNLAYYGPRINDIFEIKEVRLGEKKKKMSLQRALSTLYKKEHNWVRKLEDAWQDEDTFHTKKTFKRVKKCEKKLHEIQEQIAKLKEVK